MAGHGLVLMGRSAGAFGLKGEVKVFSFAEDPETFVEAGVVWAGPNPEQARPLHLEGVKEQGGRLVLRFREVPDREAAQALKGDWVYLKRENLPPPEPDEFYYADLLGARAETTDGRHLGVVARFLPAGPQDLLVIEDQTGRDLWVPLEGPFLEKVDLEGGKVVLDLPEGLLESQGWPE